jgi:hypothetical protein
VELRADEIDPDFVDLVDKMDIQNSFEEDQLVDTAKNGDSELEEHLLAEDCNFHPQ